MPPSFRIALYMLLLSGTGLLLAQQQPPKLDLSVTYIGERSLKASTSQNFWMQGGSIELGANLWRGWAIAADVTGTYTGSIGTSGLQLSLITTTFGPRYRWARRPAPLALRPGAYRRSQWLPEHLPGCRRLAAGR